MTTNDCPSELDAAGPVLTLALQNVRLDLEAVPGLPESGSLEPVFRSLTEFNSSPLKWVWEGLIPRGKLTLLAGEPGIGKSLFMLDVVSRVSLGIGAPTVCLPPGHSWTEYAADSVQPGTSVLASDDDSADTIRPRLEAAGADLSQVYIHCAERPDGGHHADKSSQRTRQLRSFQWKRDLATLESNLTRLRDAGVDVRLIVIDPIDRCLDTSNKNGDLARMADHLVELATWSGAGVVVVANSTSAGIGRPGHHVFSAGCQGLANAARSVLMVVRDLENASQRLLLPVKQNLCANRPGIAFSIRNGVIDWRPKTSPLTGEEYFNLAREKLRNPLIGEEFCEMTRVINWLKEQLSRGRVLSVDIRAEAAENEIGYSTLRRAFRALGCTATKDWGSGRWYWRLPGEAGTVSGEPIDVEDQVSE